MVLEKRKSFMQKSGTKRSLFRLRLRLLHAMLDCVLIVCLVIFCCSMTCVKWLRLLNEPLKKSCVVFIIWKHLFGFLLWCFIWVDLAHAYTCWLQNKSPIASMIIWFLTCDTTLCFFQWCFVAMHDYGRYCSLSWSLLVFC
jgi:hypothetical protein